MDRNEGGTVVVRCKDCTYTFSTHARRLVRCRRCKSESLERWRPAQDAA